MVDQHSLCLVLKCTPYGEKDQITQLFSPLLGRVSAYAKAIPFLQPLSLIETLLQAGKGDLYRLKEPKLIDPYLSLRDSFPRLKAGLQMADFLHSFFPEGIPKPSIFDLATFYLGKLDRVKNPDNFYHSLILKTLSSEGLLDAGALPAPLLPLLRSRKVGEIDAVVVLEEDKKAIVGLIRS